MTDDQCKAAFRFIEQALEKSADGTFEITCEELAKQIGIQQPFYWEMTRLAAHFRPPFGMDVPYCEEERFSDPHVPISFRRE